MNNQQIYKNHREQFLGKLEGRAAIIPAARMVPHHADCDYPFRQNSDFWYLTGFDEPESVALFLPHRPKGERYILFVLPKISSDEVWNGFRWGVEAVVDQFDVDVSHPLDELENRLWSYLEGADGISFSIGKHPHIEPLVLKIFSEQIERSSRTGAVPFDLTAPSIFLHDLRLRKDDWEIQRMREASSISAKAHEFARQIVRAGMNEREVQAVIEKTFLEEGARGPAYPSIIASGDNACILHYTANNALLRDGELLLIDAGCSMVDYYNSDITRTFPVNGKFTGEQSDLYELVLEAQAKAIDCVLPGKNTEEVHLQAVRVLVQGLVDLGLLKGNVDSLIEQGLYRHFYMHRTGHWLGLDVHDVGAYRLGEYPIPLEAGMVLTVEPGIYISDFFPVPDGQPLIEDRWKGIGIRVEDDVVVTNGKPDILSSNALKLLKEIEE
ncbi:aminopeptidase P N-terminal domain-containing protein [Prochlorococcus marinus]|uniref:aminopeptidase P N-terminal domain-containing protein n=1 Tax=Prochlorococcus marinus TaxID=1219 RepID=UPI0022B5D9FB|nr:aminopeptidase P N-terminal domain-containing protein [Prochlorococcus marinus]